MTKLEKNLESYLNKELNGKDYDASIDYQVLRVVRNFINSPVGDVLWSDKEGKTNVVNITYDNSVLAAITVKKIRQTHHIGYLGNYYEWKIDQISVDMKYNSFEEGIEKQNDFEAKQKELEHQRKVEIAEKAKKVMKLLNISDKYELYSFAASLKDYKYNTEFNNLLKNN